MKRVACYVRVSTEEQRKHGLSVDNQIEALTQYCKDQGYTCAGIYNDAGSSARKRYTKRPALLKLLNDCRSGKIDLIIFTRLDRWFRSVGDYYEVQRVLDECKVPWRTIWEDYETETSSGVFEVNILLSVAQAEADRTSEKIKEAIQYKKFLGKFVGSAPFGYKINKGDLIKDEACREAVEAVFDELMSSLSTQKAYNVLEAHGYKINRTHFNKWILNTAHYGEASGGFKCEPYITKAQHELISKKVKSHYNISTAKSVYFFSSLVVCECCGQKMSGGSGVKASRRDGSKTRYKHYKCKNSYSINHPFNQIAESKIENYLINNIDKIIGDYNIKIKSVEDKGEHKEQLLKKTKLESKLKKLKDLYLEEDISIEEYRSRRSILKNELDAIVVAEPKPFEPLPENWIELYKSLPDENKKAFWQNIISKITVSPDRKSEPTISLNFQV